MDKVVNYGKGIKAIAEDLHVTEEEAQTIYDTIMEEFPNLKKFMYESKSMAQNLGYVTTIFGRKRRLPNIQLPRYEYKFIGEEDKSLLEAFSKKLKYAKFNARKEIIQEAKEYGLIIKDNGGFIADAERQTVNSRVQGSAGDQVKVVMNGVFRDQLLNDLGFNLLLQVHDELIGEVPVENAARAAVQLKHIMETSLEGTLSVPSTCDIEITEVWYGEKLADITDEFERLIGEQNA